VRKLLLSYQSELRGRLGERLRRLGEDLKPEKSERDLGEIVRLIFGEAETSRAQRIHLEVTPKETLVRYRVGDRLYDALSTNPHIGNRLYEAVKTGDSFYPYNYEPFSSYETDLSKRVVFGRRSGENGVSLGGVGLSGETLDLVEATLAHGGLVALSAEKLDSLKELFYAVASEAAGDGQAVLAVEKKRERYLNHVEQAVANEKIGWSTADLLRRLLPQDFDVVMVDEIDKVETMALATAAAARGLAVFVGVEGRSMEELIENCQKLVGDSYIMSAVMRGFVWAERVRRLERDTIPSTLRPEELKDLAGFVNIDKIEKSLGEMVAGETLATANFRVRRPSDTANPVLTKTSYIYETIVIDKVTEKMLSDGLKPAVIMKRGRDGGALSLAEDALAQAALGKLDLNEAIAIIRRRH
jgi:type II secretory ATPase GspE/PulE/Tfp pilus assembly ATPase PilB-like protein